MSDEELGPDRHFLNRVEKILMVTRSKLRSLCVHVPRCTGLSVLRKLLSNSDEVVAGNAALCLGNCVGERGVASALLDSDVLLLLLRLAGGDAGGEGVQRNAAVALGKLCVSEPRSVRPSGSVPYLPLTLQAGSFWKN